MAKASINIDFEKQVINAVVAEFNVSEQLLASGNKSPHIAHIRWVAWEILCAHGYGIADAARVLDRVDHQCVINALNKLPYMVRKDEDFGYKYFNVLTGLNIRFSKIEQLRTKRNEKAKRKLMKVS